MRILMLAPTPFFSHRGCHIRIFEEAKFLMKKGHRVKIIAYHIGETPTDFDIARIPNIFWYKKIEFNVSWHKVYLDLLLFIKAFFVAFKFKPDLFHCHLYEGAFIGIILKIFFRKKLIFDSQESLVAVLTDYEFISVNSLAAKMVLVVEKFIYKFCDFIIVSNKSNYDILAEKFLLPAGKIFILPDGIDVSAIKKDERLVKEIIREYSLDQLKKTIVYLGSLNKVEGIEKMLELFGFLERSRSDFMLLVMGYPNIEYYKNLAKKMGLQDEVIFFGRINYSEIYNYLALGNFAISLKLPTSEGNGKLLNYAAAGLPIICYNHITNHYVLEENALYLEYSASPEANAKLLSDYLDINKEHLKQISAKAKEFVFFRYSWENLGQKILDIYAYANGKNISMSNL